MIKNDSQAPSCTCPSGDGSLVHPCPKHPAVDQADVAAKLTFINGRPAMCGCQVEYSDGGGEYSDVIYVTLCAKHSGSAILDLVATNRIALTPEYEGQWHADLYLDREIPLAKVEGATPAEAVLALMSAERIDPEQESVEQAGGDERAAFERAFTVQEGIYFDDKRGEYRSMNLRAIEATDAQDLNLRLQGWQARAALAQPSPVHELDPLGLAPHAEAFNEAPAEALNPGQAEAERPEVVAYRTIGRHTKHQHPHCALNYYKQNAEDQAAHWRERGCEVSEDELMTVSQHERIVGELRADRDSWAEQAEQRLADWDEMRKERDAALARVAELAQALRHLLHNIKASGKRIDLGLAKECAEDALARIDSTVAAQAQHSGPEEFSFEYRHPNGESHTVTVSRDQVINEMPDFLFEALCSKFCNCEPAGETNVVECCCDEYAEEFKLLAAAPAQAQHSVPEGWMLVPVEPLLNMMSDKDHDTRITAERQLLSILAAAPGNSVPQAWLDVQAERRRQVEAEGWTPEHDDEHDSGELAAAGAAYALHAADHLNPYSQGDGGDEAPSCWPWHDGIAGRGEGPEKTEPAWWKPSTPRRDLVKACALALAEIERLDRAAPGKEVGHE
ncbi:TPA: hypothetical protein ACRNVP_005689 [Pseudomonas aeruginosa]